MIGVGVVGFGLAGRIFHAAVVDAVDGLRLEAIVQRSGETAAAAYPGVRIARSVAELLRDPSIRLVAIATPNEAHFPVARECLLADRDVVIDKPFALTSGQAGELIGLARARGRLLSVYQNRRWDGDFRTVRALLAEGRLGPLTQFESHFDRFRPQPNLESWRDNGGPGSGVFFDLGPHLIDQALTLFGLPETIGADVRVEREGGCADDAFDVCLRYPPPSSEAAGEALGARRSGLTVWLRATCVAPDPGPRFTLNGARGTFRKFGLDPQEDALRAGDLFSSSPWGVDAEERWGTLILREDGRTSRHRIPTEAGDYRGYYSNVRDALLDKAPLEVTPVQAWRTMRVLEMALESSGAGKVIACDWSGEP